MTTRRGFLGALLAAAAAPAIVKASSLMPIYVPKIILPSLTLFGDGVTDDTAALQALLDGGAVMFAGQEFRAAGGVLALPRATFKISDTLRLDKAVSTVRGAGGTTIKLADPINLEEKPILNVTIPSSRLEMLSLDGGGMRFESTEHAPLPWGSADVQNITVYGRGPWNEPKPFSLPWGRTKQTAHGSYYGEFA